MKLSRDGLGLATLLVVGCGGQTETAAALGAVDSSGGTKQASSGTTAGGAPTSSGDRATGGEAVAATGGLATGGSRGTGGAHCDTNSNWSICVTDTAVSAASGAPSSIGLNRCSPPTSNAYVKGANYAGYAFSFISLSSTYGDNIACAVGGSGELCMSGQVGSVFSYAPVSAIGVNLNQNSTPGSPADPLAKTIRSVTVGYIASSAGGQRWFRVQVNQGTVYYCYDITDNLPSVNGGGTQYAGVTTIQANQFSTECWTNGVGTFWDGSGATGIQLIVVNVSQPSLDYDVCLNSLTID